MAEAVTPIGTESSTRGGTAKGRNCIGGLDFAAGLLFNKRGGVMAISEDCAARIDEIGKDRASGAARLAVRAASLLVEYAESAPEDIPEIANAVIGAQPSMAPIYNLARR